jgi:predicted  nucleic acid-binding Zn-ribbon protein
MMDWRHRLDEEYMRLKQRRDELRLKIDLGKKELRSTWDELDEKWQTLEEKMHQVANEAREATDDVSSAARALIDEIREGFSRVGRSL